MTAFRILLLEDDCLDADRVEAALREGGIACELLRAEQRASFVAALETDRIDLILADYDLPEFDGPTALEMAGRRCPDVPFIFVADGIGEEVAVEALKSGAADYVVKQRLGRLAASVRRALQEAQDRQKQQPMRSLTEQALQQAYAELALQTNQLEAVNQNVERILQDLQIHEEELRIQNEELIVARQIAEAEQKRYQDLFNFAPDGYVATNADGVIQEANQAIAELLSLDEVVQQPSPLSVYVAECDRRAFRNFLFELHKSSQAQQVELHLKSIKGTPFPAGITAAAIRDEQGQIQSIRWSIRDITERKQAEAELRQKNAILNAINETTPTPIFVKDRQGRIIYANPATLKVLRKTAAEVIGFRDCDLYPNAENAAKVMENDRRIMETGRMEVVEESPDGIRTFLGIKVPYRNESGEVIGLIGISNDITDRVEIERERERVLQQEQIARSAAEEANRIKDEFLAVLSHELRSPLNPILGWSRLLQNGKLDEARTKQALATIERNAKLQSELIEDLLDVSRILRGKLSLTVSPVRLASVIIAAIETVQLAAEAKSIQIETRLDPEIGTVLGDATRLQQVVWNLLSNAVKFTPEGGRVEVKLEELRADQRKIERVDDPFTQLLPRSQLPPLHPTAPQKPATTHSPLHPHAQLTISDTGKGISPGFLPHVFDYFRQASSTTTRQFGGLGLGLAIVRHLVELHGGTIQADSPGEGLGATFTVRLPLMPTQRNSGQNPQWLEPSLDLTGIHILVVDDETDTRDFVAFLLEQAGATVVTAASAAEALIALMHSPPNILLSDIGMPDMDGYTLIQQVRALPAEQGGKVPAIALTAYAGELNQRQALSVGFQQHMSKPVEPERLIRAIGSLLRQIPSP